MQIWAVRHMPRSRRWMLSAKIMRQYTVYTGYEYGHCYARYQSCNDRGFQRFRHSFLITRSVIIADDGLGRLCHGVANRKYHREKVACDAEGRNTILAKVVDKYIVTRQHHH